MPTPKQPLNRRQEIILGITLITLGIGLATLALTGLLTPATWPK